MDGKAGRQTSRHTEKQTKKNENKQIQSTEIETIIIIWQCNRAINVTVKFIKLMYLFFSFDRLESSFALFNAAFETNPLDEKCDQRLTVKSQPLKIVYDAVSTFI